MLDNLPAEITDNILHRLPVKTLIQCTCLSKSFFSLITSRAFISTHIAHNTPPHFLLRYFTVEKQEKYHLEPDNDDFSSFQTQEFLVPFNDMAGSWFNIVGSVNGVLCLVNDCCFEGTRIILWNPSVRKYVHVPKPHYVYHSYGPYESACGFGYDSILEDYKVVRVVDIGPNYTDIVFEIYSLKSGCWRPMGVGPNYAIKTVCYGYTPCSLHSSVHWICSKIMSFPKYEYVILKFDMSLENFATIDLPGMLQKSDETSNHSVDISVQECRGMLSVIYRSGDDGTCSVWVMKEYGVVNSWSKFFDFNKLRQWGTLRAFGFRKNGEVIVVKYNNNLSHRESYVVVSIDPLTNSGTAFREIYADRNSFYLSTYVESMELFHAGKRIEDLTEDLKVIPK